MNTRKLKMNHRGRKKEEIQGEKSWHMRDECRNIRNNIDRKQN